MFLLAHSRQRTAAASHTLTKRVVVGQLSHTASATTTASLPSSFDVQRRGVRLADFSEVLSGKERTLIPKEDMPKPVIYNGPETLRVAYVLDRVPKLTPENHALEYEFMDLFLEKNNQKARHKWTSFPEYYEKWKELKRKQKKPKGGSASKLDEIVYVPDPPEPTRKQWIERQRMMDGRTTRTPYADNWIKTWWPERRYTQADFDDNRYALNRKYTDRLFLIVKDGRTGKWKFPEGVRENPYTMRQACQIKFEADMDRRCAGYFMSHTPMAHYQNPENELDKTFFYHVLYLVGRPPFKRLSRVEHWADHAWVTRHEILEYDFVDEHYKETVYNMLSEGYDFMTDVDRVVDHNKIMADFKQHHKKHSAALAEKMEKEKHLVEESEAALKEKSA